MKNLKKDNRGLTLVEVMVAIAISTIVIGAIWQFMLVSTRTYQSQKQNTDLQQEVQQTLSQAENLVIDVDRAVAYREEGTKKILEIFCTDKIGKLIWDQTDKNLTYTETAVTKKVENGVSTEVVSDVTESAILAEGVEEFSADVSKVESNKILKLAMTFSRNNKTYQAARNISLRNLVAQEGNVNNIYQITATQQQKPKIEFTSLPTELQPGRTYTTLAVKVSNANKNDVYWTVRDADSTGTTIDATTGELTIGLDEQSKVALADRKLEIVVTLVEDTSVSISRVIKVTEAPLADIDITEFPKVVLYGQSYPIAATVNPNSLNIQWMTEAGSLKFDTKTGMMQVLWNQSEKVDNIIANAVVTVGTQQVAEEAKAIIRHPEFAVNVNYHGSNKPDSTDSASFEQGYTVQLSANWSASYEPNSNYVDGNEAVKYQDNLFKNETIIWKYAINDSQDYTTIKGNTFDIPVGQNIYQVRIKGAWDENEHITAEKIISVKKPKLTLKAYNSKDEEINYQAVPFGEEITVCPEIENMNPAKASYKVWEISMTGGSLDWKSIATQSAVFELTNTADTGKVISVRVVDDTTDIEATLEMKVTTYIKCNITNDNITEEFKYLYTDNSNDHQNPFLIPFANMSLVKDEIEVKLYNENDEEISNFREVIKVDLKPYGLLCKPIANSLNNVKYAIIHLDNKNTGQHMAIYKLSPTLANFSDGSGDNKIFFKLPYTIGNLNDTNMKNKEGSGGYSNFYGKKVYDYEWTDNLEDSRPQSIAYEYSYVFSSSGIIFKEYFCDLEITYLNKSILKEYKRPKFETSWEVN